MEQKSHLKKSLIVIFATAFVAIGILVYIHETRESGFGISCPLKFNFVSPDLNCVEDPEDQTMALQSAVNQTIKAHTDLSTVDRVSVFYRDLNNKQWFGINENDNFAPGSLLKLPLAVAYYKLAGVSPDVFKQQYTYKPTPGVDVYGAQYVKPEQELQVGTTYTIKDLITRMMVYSDNAATLALSDSLDQSFLQRVYIDLGVYLPTSGGIEQNFISVKTYGGILRSLYTASYLNQNSSNEILGLMASSTYKDGLVAGVPKDVVVANKFGEREAIDPNTGIISNFELHDCGIIYAPSSPYVLCVMTNGKDYDDLAKTIADVSRTVYQNR